MTGKSILIIVLVSVFQSSISFAALFQFKDKNGNLYFTNSLAQPGVYDAFKSAAEKKIKRDVSIPYARIIESAARRFLLDANLIKAVIRVESNFDPDARSKAGAMGLMQLMPATAERYGVSDAYNPEQNIMGGCAYLRELINRYKGNLRLALAAYNAGETAVDRYQGVPPYEQTRNYVFKVRDVRSYFHFMNKYRKWESVE